MNRGALLAIVAGATLAGVAGWRLFDRLSAPAGANWDEGDRPPPAMPTPESVASKLVATLPAFQLADRNGELRSLAHWQGKSLVVNFWATWCAPCRREIPLLQRIAREHAANGVQVIGIAVDFRDAVLAYADEMRIDYPLLIGEQDGLDAAAAFGIDAVGFPFTVFSDRQGRVITAHLGELHAAEAEVILEAVRSVDTGARSPEQARRELVARLAAIEPDSPQMPPDPGK